MVKIRLFCLSGISTSVLVAKMKKATKLKGIEVEIEAFPEGQMSIRLDGVDVVLLGPHVEYAFENVKKIYEPLGVPVEIIPVVDFGMMNGEKVLDLALKLSGNK